MGRPLQQIQPGFLFHNWVRLRASDPLNKNTSQTKYVEELARLGPFDHIFNPFSDKYGNAPATLSPTGEEKPAMPEPGGIFSPPSRDSRGFAQMLGCQSVWGYLCLEAKGIDTQILGAAPLLQRFQPGKELGGSTAGHQHLPWP